MFINHYQCDLVDLVVMWYDIFRLSFELLKVTSRVKSPKGFENYHKILRSNQIQLSQDSYTRIIWTSKSSSIYPYYPNAQKTAYVLTRGEQKYRYKYQLLTEYKQYLLTEYKQYGTTLLKNLLFNTTIADFIFYRYQLMHFNTVV